MRGVSQALRPSSAVEAGATLLRPAQDEFWGGRSATVGRLFGYGWQLMQGGENVSPAEMQRRLSAMLDQA